MTVCVSHGGTNVYISNSPSHMLLVGTVSGIYILRQEPSNSWVLDGVALEGCHISSLVIEPTSGLLFAGAHKGSIHASSDGGQTWEHRDRGLTSKDVFCINYCKVNGGVRLFAGTEPARLFTSRDLGENWFEIPALRGVPSVSRWYFPPPPHAAHVKNIVTDPANSDVIYACIEQGGLLKSQDGGNSWAELQGFDEDVHRVQIRPSDSNRLFMATRAGIYESRDAGKRWEQITTEALGIAYPDALLIHPRREDLMFTAGAETRPFEWIKNGTANSKIARTRDGGRSWQLVGQGLPEKIRGNIEAMAMEVYGRGVAIFAATTDGDVFWTEDEGNSWSKLCGALPPISKAHHYLNFR